MSKLILAVLLALGCTGGALAQERREFLSPAEIDNIRDEQDQGKRVLLYLQFAQRRLDAVRANLASGGANAGRSVQQSLSEYNSILDALSDSLNLAREQRTAMGKPIKELQSRVSGFLRYLETVDSARLPHRGDYDFTLQEAIDTTKDELADAKKGAFPEIHQRKPPSLPAAPSAGSNASGQNGAGGGSSGSEEGPPRKKPRSPQSQ